MIPRQRPELPPKRWSTAALALLTILVGPPQAFGWTLFDESPERRVERLASDWRLTVPEGAGPHPAAILLSGCDGVHDNMDFWAAEFARRGRATLIVDSHGPRDLDRFEAWRLVCSGIALTGSERAGDVAVALDALARMDEIRDDVVILGASHGGWAAMEFVTHATSGETPPGLTHWPAPPRELLSHVSALILLYPYCGFLNGSADWQDAPPTKMVLAEDDSIVSTTACLALAKELGEGGATFDAAILPDADHGFDQREKSVLSTLAFDAAQRDAARELVEQFLDAYAP